jgi:hypothetical protein
MTMNKLFPIILFFLIGGANFVNAQHTIQHVQALQGDPKVYTTKKISQEIEIDGKMEAIWNNAPWSSEFMDIEGVTKLNLKCFGIKLTYTSMQNWRSHIFGAL